MRVNISWSVVSHAWPRCSLPVTFGGGWQSCMVLFIVTRRFEKLPIKPPFVAAFLYRLRIIFSRHRNLVLFHIISSLFGHKKTSIITKDEGSCSRCHLFSEKVKNLFRLSNRITALHRPSLLKIFHENCSRTTSDAAAWKPRTNWFPLWKVHFILLFPVFALIYIHM